MRIYSGPRRGYCASCELKLTGRPVYFMDETYCCTGCAQGGPCVCSYEADMADDGVNGLGLLVDGDVEVVRDPALSELQLGK